MKNIQSYLFRFAFLSIFCLSGCIGFDVPQPFQHKPYTLINGGDQLGRDQLANRYLVANKLLPLVKGMDTNEILTWLGQPQTIQVTERHTSEDWYFVHYRRYKTMPETPEGLFIVRFFEDKVIDVVKES